jgi:hypothetical protein
MRALDGKIALARAPPAARARELVYGFVAAGATVYASGAACGAQLRRWTATRRSRKPPSSLVAPEAKGCVQVNHPDPALVTRVDCEQGRLVVPVNYVRATIRFAE